LKDVLRLILLTYFFKRKSTTTMGSSEKNSFLLIKVDDFYKDHLKSKFQKSAKNPFFLPRYFSV